MYEAFRIHTLDHYVYHWERTDGRRVRDKTIREIIGESIPPAGLQVIIDHIVDVYNDTIGHDEVIGPLFSSRLL